MRIHRLGVLGVALAFATAACGSGAAGTPAPVSVEVHGSLNEVMKSILFPNSNIIFEMQERDPGAPVDLSGAGLYAEVYPGWQRVELAGKALAESANLIAIPGRLCENGRAVPLDEAPYEETVQGLRDVGMAAYEYARNQRWDEESAFELADQLAVACANCHDVYRDRVVDNRMIGIEDRCVQ